ncbi:MAG: LSM domain-containing protein [Nitrosopumilus sp.]|nr:ribonucleoprotein [Nitrososphaerota archaeon]MCH8085813.1 ribonucleoprotein [Nitrososphaerota archaeon]
MYIDIPTLLKHNKNKIIQIRIRGNKTIRGILQEFDRLMNMTLNDAEDISGTKIVKLGKILLRGNNIIVISFDEESK